MRTAYGQDLSRNAQSCNRSNQSEIETYSFLSIALEGRAWSVLRASALFTALVMIALVSVNCDIRPDRSTAQISNIPTGEGEMAGSSYAMSLDSIPVYPSDSGIRLNDSSSLTDDWPTDVPVYPGLKMLYSANMKGSITIQATSDDTPSKVAGFYKAHTAEAGWAEETTIAEKQMVLLSFVKNKRKLSIVITEHEGGALVALTFING